MEAPSLNRRLVAILAADVEGYSRLMAVDEEAALATLSAHRKAVDELILAFGGRIANTAGDSVLAEFASVVDTVRCAVRMQHAVAELNAALSEEQRMWFRVGINVGDIMAKDGDIFGDGVNIAARLQALAEAGGICVSRGVRDQIRHIGSFGFEDLGEQQVKNIERPIRAFRVIADPAAVPDPADAAEALDLSAAGAIADPAAAVEVAMWQAASSSDRVQEYLVYLERFPAGEFAGLARERIAALSEPPAEPAGVTEETAIELSFWESVKGSTNPALYEAYLARYPEGNFVLLAEAMLDELRSSPPG